MRGDSPALRNGGILSAIRDCAYVAVLSWQGRTGEFHQGVGRGCGKHLHRRVHRFTLLEFGPQADPRSGGTPSAAFERDQRVESHGGATVELYQKLPLIDFSQDILAPQVTDLRVLPVRACGWSDLGTPKQVAGGLRGARGPLEGYCPLLNGASLSLADQYERMRAVHEVGPAS